MRDFGQVIGIPLRPRDPYLLAVGNYCQSGWLRSSPDRGSGHGTEYDGMPAWSR